MFFTDLFATFFAIGLLLSNFDFGAGDVNANCKTKVLKMSLKHCLNDGVSRSKRDVKEIGSIITGPENPPRLSGKRQISPQAASALVQIAGPIISRVLLRDDHAESRSPDIPSSWDRGYAEEPRRPINRFPGYQGFGFRPPASGDDLGMGLSENDMEDLFNAMIERLPRAAKDKEQTIRMITAYAASCCNENLGSDTCSDSVNVINCP